MRVLVLLLLSFCLFSTSVRAEIKISVVDIESILSDSKAAMSIKKQVAEKRREFLDAVKAAEDKLRADKKAIENERSKLSKEALLKKAQGFEKGRIKARNAIQAKKSKLDKAYSDAMDILTKTIFSVSQEIANEDQIDLIITRQNIIVGSMSLDITQKVMKRMNKKLPNLILQIK